MLIINCFCGKLYLHQICICQINMHVSIYIAYIHQCLIWKSIWKVYPLGAETKESERNRTEQSRVDRSGAEREATWCLLITLCQLFVSQCCWLFLCRLLAESSPCMASGRGTAFGKLLWHCRLWVCVVFVRRLVLLLLLRLLVQYSAKINLFQLIILRQICQPYDPPRSPFPSPLASHDACSGHLCCWKSKTMQTFAWLWHLWLFGLCGVAPKLFCCPIWFGDRVRDGLRVCTKFCRGNTLGKHTLRVRLVFLHLSNELNPKSKELSELPPSHVQFTNFT